MEVAIKVIGTLFAVLVALTTLYKFFWKAPSEKETKQIEDKAEITGSRFVALFESHGIHRNQIPEFFNHDLTTHACSNDEELLKVLTPEMLVDAASFFGANIEWLQGASDKIYNVDDFYKQPNECRDYLTDIKNSGSDNNFFTFVIFPHKSKRFSGTYDGLMIITETIGEINGRSIYRYYVSSSQAIDYWKSKAYFTACCALLFKHQFHPIGKIASQDWIESMLKGTQLIKYDYENFVGDINIPTESTRYVDEMIKVPDKYLENVSPEENNFGLKAAISHWLTLADFMNCFGDDTHQQVIERYESKLDELSS